MRLIRFTSKVSFFALAIGVLLGHSGIASAGIIGTFTNAGFSYPNNGPTAWTGPSSVGVTLQLNGQTVSDGTATLNQGGAFLWSGTYTPTGGAGTTVTGLLTYCIEVNQNIYPGYSGQTYYVTTDVGSAPIGTALPAMGSQAAGYLAELWAKHIQDATSSNNGSGAFQLAIWKLEYDVLHASSSPAAPIQIVNGVITDVNWGTGSLQATGNQAELDLAKSYLMNLTSDASAANLRALISGNSNGNYQDQLFAVPGPNSVFAVPEPAGILTWLLIGSVAGCASFVPRRRKTAA